MVIGISMNNNSNSSGNSSNVASSGSENTEISARRRLVAGYLAQRLTDARQIAGLVGLGNSAEGAKTVEGDIAYLKGEWRRERRAILDSIGDSTIKALDADELTLRSMLQRAKSEGGAKLGTVLKLMDMIRETQKMRLALAGLLSSDGIQSFRSGVAGGSGDGDGTDADGMFRVYGDEVEGRGVEEEAGKGSDDGNAGTQGNARKVLSGKVQIDA